MKVVFDLKRQNAYGSLMITQSYQQKNLKQDTEVLSKDLILYLTKTL